MRESSARRSSRAAGRASATAAALVLVGLSALAGCGGAEAPDAAPSASPTPLARLNTASLQVPRIEFCPLVPTRAVGEALGARPASRDTYGNGDEQQLTGVGTDVLHEIGCAWTGPASSGAPTVARAWVFARPVEAGYARTVVRAARTAGGCRVVGGAAYGEPSVTQVCTLGSATGPTRRVRHAGLFGQTWLTCELQGPSSADLRGRAEAWCVQVANALDTSR